MIPIEDIEACARATRAVANPISGLHGAADRVLEWLEAQKQPPNPTPELHQQWVKRSHTKTSTNAPRIRLTWVGPETVTARAMNFAGKYGFNKLGVRNMRVSTLQESWRLIG